MAKVGKARTGVRRWLDDAAFVTAEGDVLAWLNVDHPGHAYPEAAGLYLRWLSQTATRASPTASTAGEQVSQRLWALVANDAIGRDGYRYTFDEGVALAGLCAATNAVAVPTFATALERVAYRLRHQIATDPPRADRWSTRVGPHCIKLSVAAGLGLPHAGAQELARVVAEIPFDQDATGRIATPPHRFTYVHAHAYAAEGLLVLCQLPQCEAELRSTAHDAAARAASWLERVQDASGGCTAWHDGTVGVGSLRTDATAQAVRLWAILDREAFKPAIERGLSFLASVSSASGGIPYAPSSPDINTWCTLFADQAFAFADGELTLPSQLL